MQDNKALFRQLFEHGVNHRDVDALDELIAADFVLHSAILGELRGREAYKQSVRALLDTSADFRATIDELIEAEHGKVVARLTYRGTDSGGFVRGYPATGKPFEFTAIYLAFDR